MYFILFVGFLKLSRFTAAETCASKNKFENETAEEYYEQIWNECDRFVLLNVYLTTDDKILKNLDAAKSSEVDQLSAKFLKDGAPVIANHLFNIINRPIKLDTFPSKYKIKKTFV